MKCIRFSRLFSLTLAVALCLSLSSCKSKEDPSANFSADHSAAQSVMQPILPEETPIEEKSPVVFTGKRQMDSSPKLASANEINPSAESFKKVASILPFGTFKEYLRLWSASTYGVILISVI